MKVSHRMRHSGVADVFISEVEHLEQQVENLEKWKYLAKREMMFTEQQQVETNYNIWLREKKLWELREGMS